VKQLCSYAVMQLCKDALYEQEIRGRSHVFGNPPYVSRGEE